MLSAVLLPEVAEKIKTSWRFFQKERAALFAKKWPLTFQFFRALTILISQEWQTFPRLAAALSSFLCCFSRIFLIISRIIFKFHNADSVFFLIFAALELNPSSPHTYEKNTKKVQH